MKSIRWSRMCEEGPASKVMREYGEEEAKRTKKERKKKKGGNRDSKMRGERFCGAERRL